MTLGISCWGIFSELPWVTWGGVWAKCQWSRLLKSLFGDLTGSLNCCQMCLWPVIMFVVCWLARQDIQILSCKVDGNWLRELPVNTAWMPCCSQPAAKPDWQWHGLTLILFWERAPCLLVTAAALQTRSSERDLSLHCSDGIYAVCWRLLRATAVHVLPDPSEWAHLPAEEQAPHGSLWVQWLLYQLRPLTRSGTSSCSPTETAAAGEWHLRCPPGRAHQPPRNSSVLATPVSDRLWWWEDVSLVLPHHAPCHLVNVFLGILHHLLWAPF